MFYLPHTPPTPSQYIYFPSWKIFHTFLAVKPLYDDHFTLSLWRWPVRRVQPYTVFTAKLSYLQFETKEIRTSLHEGFLYLWPAWRSHNSPPHPPILRTALLPTPLPKLLPLFGKMSPHSLSETAEVEPTKTLLAITILPDRQATCTAKAVDKIY